MSVGSKLRSLRGNKTLQATADAIGITKSALAMYEKDKRVPRDEVKVRVAKYYGVTVQSLFFADNEHI